MSGSVIEIIQAKSKNKDGEDDAPLVVARAVYEHPFMVRLCHWVNTVALFVGQDVVPGSIHHPAAMLLDQIRDDPFIGLQGPHGRRFILTHEAAVTCRVGAENGREFAFETFCGHGIASEGFLEGNFKPK